MKLEHQDLIKEFYDSIHSHFPGLTQQELNHICCAPFKHLKKMMEGDKVDTMRFKYFGSFVVFPRKAKSELSYLDGRLERKIITQEQYDRLKLMLTNFIEEDESKR